MSAFQRRIFKHRKVAVPQSLADVATYYESTTYLKLIFRFKLMLKNGLQDVIHKLKQHGLSCRILRCF